MKKLLKWCAATVVLGVLCGVTGFLFSEAITFVTAFRGEHKWILLLLPVAGVLTVLLYKALKVTGVGTVHIFEGVRGEIKVPKLLTPAVFLASSLTHLCGGSAGREGAALQMGGSIASVCSGAFKLSDKERRFLTVVGMAAFFSAVFGTPLGAAIFAVEVIRKKEYYTGIIPSLVSSFIAFFTATFLGAEPERFSVPDVTFLDFSNIWKVLALAVLCGVVGAVFCRSLHIGSHIFKKLFKNDIVCAVIGAVMIIIMTIAVGNMDYNGSGMELILRAFENEKINYYDFLLKMIFTVVTVGAGFKGGEIIPTFCIGATFGTTVALLLGLNPLLGAAVGMGALFAAVTNCPLATVFLCFEMFGIANGGFFVLAVLSAFVCSGKDNIYNVTLFETKVSIKMKNVKGEQAKKRQ